MPSTRLLRLSVRARKRSQSRGPIFPPGNGLSNRPRKFWPRNQLGHGRGRRWPHRQGRSLRIGALGFVGAAFPPVAQGNTPSDGPARASRLVVRLRQRLAPMSNFPGHDNFPQRHGWGRRMLARLRPKERRAASWGLLMPGLQATCGFQCRSRLSWFFPQRDGRKIHQARDGAGHLNWSTPYRTRGWRARPCRTAQ